MMTANEAYEIAKAATMETTTWKYLVDRINWHTKEGHVQMFVSFDHNPQTALHMLRELGYNVTPQDIDKNANYYSFIISWFPMPTK